MLKTHRGDGGSSVLSDGFHVAEEMRRLYPDHFAMLTDNDVYFWDKGDTEPGIKIKSFDKISRGPIIQ